MKLSLFERRVSRQGVEHMIDRDGATLRVVERPAAPSWEPIVIQGGAGTQTSTVRAKAEIRAKRFRDGSVAEDRYEAMLSARDDSPASLMSALVEAFSAIPEFRAGGDERIVLQVSLSR